MDFNKYSQQNVADMIKNVFLRRKCANEHQLYEALKRFETGGWYPAIITPLLEALGFELDEDKPRFVVLNGDACEAVAALLGRYNAAVAAIEGVEIEAGDDLLSTNEAADYLGVGVPAIRRAHYVTEKLAAVKRGNSLFFRRGDLDAYLRYAQTTPRGRWTQEKWRKRLEQS